MPMAHLLLAVLVASAPVDAAPQHGRCAPAGPHWARPSEGVPDHVLVQVVALRGRDILWNRRSVSRQRLRTYLARTRRMSPTPFILFDPSEARDCAFAAEIRAVIDGTARCGRLSVCGEGPRHAWRWSIGE